MAISAARMKRLRTMYLDFGSLLKEAKILTERDLKALAKVPEESDGVEIISQEGSEIKEENLVETKTGDVAENKSPEIPIEPSLPDQPKAPIDFSASAQTGAPIKSLPPNAQEQASQHPEPPPPQQGVDNRTPLAEVSAIIRELNATSSHYQEILDVAMRTFQARTLADVRPENVELFKRHIEAARAQFPG